MHKKIITHISQMERCPHCEAPLTGETLDERVYKSNLVCKAGLPLSVPESEAKAATYGWGRGRPLKISRIKFIITGPQREANYYECPDCQTLFDLYTGKEFSEHEKSIVFANLST